MCYHTFIKKQDKTNKQKNLKMKEKRKDKIKKKKLFRRFGDNNKPSNIQIIGGPRKIRGWKMYMIKLW